MAAPPTAARDRAVTERPEKPRTAGRTVLAVLVVVAVTIWSAVGIGVDFGAIAENWGNASGTIGDLVQPDYAFFPRTLPALSETVMMAVLATAVGAAISLPVSFLASAASNPSTWLRRAVRLVINVVRAVPDLLYAAVLVSVVGTGALSGIIALTLFDLGIIVKLVSEAIDGVDRGPQEAALAAGATWTKADRWAVLPLTMPAYVSQVLYTFELNIRASSVIGLVGAGGLGVLIDNVRTFYQYHYLSLVILEILVLVVVIEVVSSAARKRLAG